MDYTVRLFVLSISLFFNAISYAAELKVLAWPGYCNDEAISSFEKNYNASVSITYVNNDDQLSNHLNSKVKYDVVAMNTAELNKLVMKGRLQPIDLKLIPNSTKLQKRFATQESDSPLAEHYNFGIPFAYSSMGIIYKPKPYTPPPTSWSVFWEKQNSNSTLIYDGSSHNISLATLYANSAPTLKLTHTNYKDVIKHLVNLRMNSYSVYQSIEEASELFLNKDINYMFANFGTQQLHDIKRLGVNVSYTIPKEGALAWLDSWVIPSDASQVILAHQWINTLLEPETAEYLESTEGLGVTTIFAQQKLRQDEKLHWVSTPDKPELRAKIWNLVYEGYSADTIIESIEFE
jgi:putative spermidine/putrescine transport system substrate-binding protein